MRILHKAGLLGAIAGAGLLMSGATVPASPLGSSIQSFASAKSASTVMQVQFRRRRGGRGPGLGAAAAAGVIGAVVGGIIASQAGPPPPPAVVVEDDGAIAYCMQTYRSYNLNTGTYRGFDGFDHPCP